MIVTLIAEIGPPPGSFLRAMSVGWSAWVVAWLLYFVGVGILRRLPGKHDRYRWFSPVVYAHPTPWLYLLTGGSFAGEHSFDSFWVFSLQATIAVVVLLGLAIVVPTRRTRPGD